jgi:subtilisin family serine protease
MTSRLAGLLLCALGALSLGAPTVRAQNGAARLIMRAPAPLVDVIAARHHLDVVQVLRDDVERVVMVQATSGITPEDLDSELETDDQVIGCEIDRRVRVPELAATASLSQSTAAILEGLTGRTLVNFFGSVASSTYAAQPAIGLMRVARTRSIVTGMGVVAIIDTGVDATHPLLGGVTLPGYDFTRDVAGSASDFIDLEQSTAAILEQSTAAILEQRSVVTLNQSTAAILEQSTAAILEGLPPLPAAFGHGTMVAGLVHLVAPTAGILPLKAFNADGSSSLSNIIRAIYYAVDHGAQVINMSFSLTESSEELLRAIDYATSHRVICVAAVGNQAKETVVYPAAYRNVIAVASSSNIDRRSAFTNFGDGVVTVAAPGETLTTTYPGGRYAAVAGTSFSAALVSGGVALMIEAWPWLTPGQAGDDLAKDAAAIRTLGNGRVDLFSAVMKASSRH